MSLVDTVVDTVVAVRDARGTANSNYTSCGQAEANPVKPAGTEIDDVATSDPSPAMRCPVIVCAPVFNVNKVPEAFTMSVGPLPGNAAVALRSTKEPSRATR